MAADTQVCVAVFLAVNCPPVLVRLASFERVMFKMDFAVECLSVLFGIQAETWP